MKKTIIFAFSVMLVITACNQSGKKTNVESTAENQSVETIDGNELTACQHQTKIFWSGSKPTGVHDGFLKLKEGGNFIVEDNKLVGGKFIIDMNSIVCMDVEDEEMNGKLVGHLKSADFFHVDSFPEAQFVISQVEEIKEEAFNTILTGNLTMKDITHEISFKAKVDFKGNGMIAAKSEEIVLDRTKWNVNYGSKSVFKDLKDKFINDEFKITIDAHSM